MRRARPTRIDLLELDIDLRLDRPLARGVGIEEWSIEVVSAFMRAAYGKGYCDALTEESPGALCADHGYRVPARGRRRRADVLSRERLGRHLRHRSPRRWLN